MPLLPSGRFKKMSEPLDLETIRDMVVIAMLLIQKGEHDLALNQLSFIRTSMDQDEAVAIRDMLAEHLGSAYVTQ